MDDYTGNYPKSVKRKLQRNRGVGYLIRFFRFFGFTSYLIICCAIGLGILACQIAGSPLYFYSKSMYYKWMARTKQHFAVLATTVTHTYAPTVCKVTGTREVRREMRQTEDGRLECDFADRIVLLGNHQLYTDWLYLWWVAYTSGKHGYLYIILKESLKYVPLFGMGMQFYGFIFLSRKWEKDKARLEYRLSKISELKSPFWLLIFPEGTTLCAETRKKSVIYAQKVNKIDLKHVLLPRATGLRFCLETLDGAIDYVYDCTIGYEGVPRDVYSADVYTLFGMYFKNRPPKAVHMYWRKFPAKDIPFRDETAFDQWLTARWSEKDILMKYFIENGVFPGEDSDSEPIETEIKLKYWWHILDAFFVLGFVYFVWRLLLTVQPSLRYFFFGILILKKHM